MINRERNLALLTKNYPALAKKLFPHTGDTSENAVEVFEGALSVPGGAEIRVEKAATGDPALVINGVHVHSNRDPAREGARQAEAAFAGAGEGALAFAALGFGLGYGAEALARKAGSRPVVIVERRPDLFRLALDRRDLTVFLSSGALIFVLGGEADGVLGALELLERAGIRTQPVILKNRALCAASPEDEAFYADVERRIAAWSAKDEINAATLRRFGKRWTGNLAANAGAIRDLPGVGRLEGCLRGAGIPVFLAAAGPTLDECGPFLQQIHERCLIAAVDTSLRFLSAAGVCPDFTVAVDPQFWNARHLDRLRGPALVAESAVYPPVLRGPSFTRRFLCRSMFPLGRFVEDRTDPKGALGAGGSVATTAWDFARLLSPASIWIAGLDLAFPGLKTHFHGALFEENVHAASSRFSPAETASYHALHGAGPFWAASVDGGRALTDKRLSLYAAWFENRAGQERNIQSYSLSPSGLAIKGLIPAKIETLLELPPRRPLINALLGAAFARAEESFTDEAPARAERYEKAVRDLAAGLEAIREQAENAASLARNALRETRRASDAAGREKVFARLDAANKAVAASPVKDAAGFLFPPTAELEARLAETDLWRRHLEFSALLYEELAGAAGYTHNALRKRAR